MAAKKKKPTGAPESAQALGAAMETTTAAPPGENVTGETPKKRGRKQPDLPAMDGAGVNPTVPELEDLCAGYNSAKNRRVELTADETKTRNELLAGMHKHKLAEYEFDGVVFEIAHKDETETIKVRKAKKKPDYETVKED